MELWGFTPKFINKYLNEVKLPMTGLGPWATEMRALDGKPNAKELANLGCAADMPVPRLLYKEAK